MDIRMIKLNDFQLWRNGTKQYESEKPVGYISVSIETTEEDFVLDSIMFEPRYHFGAKSPNDVLFDREIEKRKLQAFPPLEPPKEIR